MQASSFPPFFPRVAPGTSCLYCWRRMSCCGSARPPVPDKNGPGVGTRSVAIDGSSLLQQTQFPISEQPGGHPGIISPFPPPAHASSFRPPDITSPPLAYSTAHLNGTSHSPPPTASTIQSSFPPSSPSVPQMGMYTSSSSPAVDPNGPLSPLRRPTPTYPASGNSHSPNLLSTYQTSGGMPSSLPPIDEGKVSVSIDFGERRLP